MYVCDDRLLKSDKLRAVRVVCENLRHVELAKWHPKFRQLCSLVRHGLPSISIKTIFNPFGISGALVRVKPTKQNYSSAIFIF